MEKRFETSRIFEGVGRAGLFARAVVYALIAGLMLHAVLLPGAGAGSDNAREAVGPGEAFQWLETEIYGQALLAAIAVGLGLYALWRFIQAIADTGDEGCGAKGVVARVGMAASGSGYALIGAAAIAVLIGRNEGSGGGATRTFIQWLLEQPFGPALAIVLGAMLAASGAAQIWRAAAGQWTHDLDLSGWVVRIIWVIALSIGLRGVLFMIAGVFVIIAGWQVDPTDAKGLTGALTWLRRQPFGVYFYILGASALGGYGLYSFVQSIRRDFGRNTHA